MRNLNARLPLAGFFALLLVTTVAPAEAGFMGYYDVAHWTTTVTPGTSNGSVDTTSAPASVTLTGGDNGGGSSTVDFTITAPVAGPVSFSWDYTSFDFDGPSWDPFGYVVNGLFHQLTNDGGPASQSGVASFFVNSGDVFGFQQQSVDSIFGPGVATVSDFNAVPEPTTLALLGLGLLGGARRMRNRQQLQ